MKGFGFLALCSGIVLFGVAANLAGEAHASKQAVKDAKMLEPGARYSYSVPDDLRKWSRVENSYQHIMFTQSLYSDAVIASSKGGCDEDTTVGSKTPFVLSAIGAKPTTMTIVGQATKPDYRMLVEVEYNGCSIRELADRDDVLAVARYGVALDHLVHGKAAAAYRGAKVRAFQNLMAEINSAQQSGTAR